MNELIKPNKLPAPPATAECDSDGCGCHALSSALGRRDFLKLSALAATGLAFAKLPVMAGPFTPSDFEQIIPADKKLSKEWIASLTARGQPLSAAGADLKYIGMPINGICTGQVYLGGDGQLWRWNLDASRDFAKDTAKGPRFMQPDVAHSPMSQGFALQVGSAGREQVFSLNAKGFQNVTFTNHYPMATVDYADAACPVAVQLQAYTPFIPLNRDDSSYPVVVLRYTITNLSASEQQVAIAGWVENISNARSGAKAVGKKLCAYREQSGISTVECFAEFQNPEAMNSQADFGAIALGLLGSEKPDIVDIARSEPEATGVFAPQLGTLKSGALGERDFKERAFASLGRKLTLKPGESKTIAFVLSWRFPNVNYNRVFGRKTVHAINHYATLWPTAAEAAGAVAAREAELHRTTQQWVDTWYNSTLPYWFLERTFVTLNCVQTQMGQRLAKGQEPEHYNFEEGVKCCPGNCAHVWHYAQGLARVFPQIERENRDKIEYGLGFDPNTGVVYFRYTIKDNPDKSEAIDGTCGTILRVMRESQMTADYRFLESIWERTKLSMDHVITKWDPDEDGMLEGSQHNTLDEPWFGQVHWLINLYHAALKASAVMARQMQQPAVAERYENIVAKGAPQMVELLWNEDYGYFIHKPGPGENQSHGSLNGCHIDQLLGDSWLWNVGLDRVLPQAKIQQTLESLWKYNFAPDVGVFRDKVPEGRWYAAAGNAGLVMCTFPHGKIEPTSGKKNYAGYLNECMTGFEWQVAAHMIWEGMVEKGLAVGKAIYDRYQPRDRNPYNEVECSDHYSRAMASYGAYLAICGYRYDGPAGELAFAPRLAPEDFRCAFTAAEGWGTFLQKFEAGGLRAEVQVKWGQLRLQSLALQLPAGLTAPKLQVTLGGNSLAAKLVVSDRHAEIQFERAALLPTGQPLNVIITG